MGLFLCFAIVISLLLSLAAESSVMMYIVLAQHSLIVLRLLYIICAYWYALCLLYTISDDPCDMFC